VTQTVKALVPTKQPAYLSENSQFPTASVILRQRKSNVESMASSKVTYFLMVVLLVGTSKTEIAEHSEGNEIDFVYFLWMSSENKLCLYNVSYSW